MENNFGDTVFPCIMPLSVYIDIESVCVGVGGGGTSQAAKQFNDSILII